MIDIFITTYNREGLFKESLQSLLKSTDRNLFRLTIVVDGSKLENLDLSLLNNADHVLWHNSNLGLGPSINQALVHINNLNTYFDNQQNQFICYCQDDVSYEDKWLEKLVKVYRVFSKKYDIGFLSGHNAPEHEKTGEIKFGKDILYLKPWIRATNMFATAEYFLSMYPISRIDPETRRERAKPNNGMGSSVDWWFIRNHPNSVCKINKINIVYPNLIKHIGFDQSTWLDRALPED